MSSQVKAKIIDITYNRENNRWACTTAMHLCLVRCVTGEKVFQPGTPCTDLKTQETISVALHRTVDLKSLTASRPPNNHDTVVLIFNTVP